MGFLRCAFWVLFAGMSGVLANTGATPAKPDPKATPAAAPADAFRGWFYNKDDNTRYGFAVAEDPKGTDNPVKADFPFVVSCVKPDANEKNKWKCENADFGTLKINKWVPQEKKFIIGDKEYTKFGDVAGIGALRCDGKDATLGAGKVKHPGLFEGEYTGGALKNLVEGTGPDKKGREFTSISVAGSYTGAKISIKSKDPDKDEETLACNVPLKLTACPTGLEGGFGNLWLFGVPGLLVVLLGVGILVCVMKSSRSDDGSDESDDSEDK